MDNNIPVEPFQVDTMKLNHALNGKISRCPACGSSSFTAMPTLMELREFRQGSLVVGGSPIVPLAVLTCQNCGNTLLINALVTGLMENPKPEDES